MIVVDTNVLAYTLLEGARTAACRTVFARDPTWAAPPLARSELRSVLVGEVRGRRLSRSEALHVLDAVDEALQDRQLDVESARVLDLAFSSGCSAYDCEFVALAEALDVVLVTTDHQMLAAFPDRAVAPETFAGEGTS